MEAIARRWDKFELSFTVSTSKNENPFTDHAIHAVFESSAERAAIEGFYDGDQTFRVRFMPSFEGEYRYTVTGTMLDAPVTGTLRVLPPEPRNHGVMRVSGCHFVYEDGTPYYEAGTTCYAWTHQPDELAERTLQTLAGSGFNKLRFCLFPKHYLYNLNEPATYPYEGTPCTVRMKPEGGYSIVGENHWDFSRFCPAHFKRIDRAIERLGELGIEADLIIMHPYDRWGFSEMSREQNDLYWRYVIARYSAYHNVWWSLANEWDILPHLSIADWERLAGLLVERDPYRHLRSIHNCMTFYDHNRPWITHCSIQRQDVYKCAELTDEYRRRYQKPVVLDEIAYEGDIDQGWGNITGQELTRRFWEASVRGGYAGHGETFDRPDGVLWWSHGGGLHGESPERIAFLRRILEQTPGLGLRWRPASWDDACAQAENGEEYYLYYYGNHRPSSRTFTFPTDRRYRAEVIDTWNMTLTDAGIHQGTFTIVLPRREYMAIRLRAEA